MCFITRFLPVLLAVWIAKTLYLPKLFVNLLCYILAGVLCLSAAIGSGFSGPMMRHFGRHRLLSLSQMAFILGWILIILGNGFYVLTAGRFFTGLGTGTVIPVVQVYVTEIDHKKRDLIIALPQTLLSLGILLSYIFSLLVTYKVLAGVSIVIPVFIGLIMWTMPEFSSDMPISTKRGLKRQISLMVKKKFFIPVLIYTALMVIQKISGIYNIIFFAISKFSHMSDELNPKAAAVVLGIIQVIGHILVTFLCRKLGKKLILIFSVIIMSITLYALGTYFYLKMEDYDLEGTSWIPITCVMVYVLAYSLGCGPIPYLLLDECLTMNIRGVGSAIGFSVNMLTTFIMCQTMYPMIANMGYHGTYWFYASSLLVGSVFIILCVPEKKKKSMENQEIPEEQLGVRKLKVKQILAEVEKKRKEMDYYETEKKGATFDMENHKENPKIEDPNKGTK